MRIFLSAREWHNMPLHGIDDPNFLELSALKALGWNITIDVVRWNQWMATIKTSHSMMARHRAVSREFAVLAGVIERVNRQDPHWDCHCEARDRSSDPSRFFCHRQAILRGCFGAIAGSPSAISI